VLLACAVDLTPGSLAPVPDAASRGDGAARLVEVARAQGLERWQRFSELRFRLVDASAERCVHGAWIPFFSATQTFQVQLAVRDSAVRARFVDGPRAGETLGIKGDLAYRIGESGALEFGRDACIEGYLRSVQDSLVLPLRLAAQTEIADAAAFASGQRALDGRSYDLVFVTVPAPYGTAAEEQYVLWIERASGRVEWLELTDRRRSRRAHSVLHYLEYRDVQGVMLPTRIERVGSVGANGGERLELSDLNLG
jgi:hypothetical protein